MSFVAKWMDLEIIMLGEVQETRKDKSFVFSLVRKLKKGKVKIEGWLLELGQAEEAAVDKSQMTEQSSQWSTALWRDCS